MASNFEQSGNGDGMRDVDDEDDNDNDNNGEEQMTSPRGAFFCCAKIFFYNSKGTQILRIGSK
jgi:hypothetical protein